MSKSFEKARKREERKKSSWYIVRIGQYKCCFLLVPLIPIVRGWEKMENWKYKRLTWSEEKAQKILNYLLPKLISWDSDEERYFYNVRGRLAWTKKSRPWHREWISKFELELQEFIKDKYENDKYIKLYEKDDWYNEWVYFVEKEK